MLLYCFLKSYAFFKAIITAAAIKKTNPLSIGQSGKLGSGHGSGGGCAIKKEGTTRNATISTKEISRFNDFIRTIFTKIRYINK